jgi:hypothetical protein
MMDATTAALAMELGLLNSDRPVTHDILSRVHDGLSAISTDTDTSRVRYGATPSSLLPTRL